MTVLNLNAECGCEIETNIYKQNSVCNCGDYCYCYDYEDDYTVYSTKIVKPCDEHGE